MSTEKRFEFRDLFNSKLIQQIAQDIHLVYPDFDRTAFADHIHPQLAPLALKERANCIAEALHLFLPKDFNKAGHILLESLGAELEEIDFSGASAFMYMPHGIFVSRYGLNEQHFELSTTFLYEMTKRFSAEFAIRPFLDKHPDKMLQKLQQWVVDDNQHVRRLVSEGTRPRLPWAARLTVFDDNYTVISHLLDQLKNDPELYVRRSVANHLNDLTKDRKALVIKKLTQWNKKATPAIQWITKHALRSLIKAGDKAALGLLGFSDQPKVEVQNFKLQSNSIKIGEQLAFSFEILSLSKEKQPLIIDYSVHFMKANGQQAPKVFKLKIADLAANQRLKVKKKQRFQQLSTRTLYVGQHSIALQINGQTFGKLDFDLLP